MEWGLISLVPVSILLGAWVYYCGTRVSNPIKLVQWKSQPHVQTYDALAEKEQEVKAEEEVAKKLRAEYQVFLDEKPEPSIKYAEEEHE